MQAPSSQSPAPSVAASASDDTVVRRGRVSWLTHPPSGIARVESDSNAFHAMPVNLPQDDPTLHDATPGELLAIAYGMFMAAALAELLVVSGSPADEIVVEVDCVFAGTFPERELAEIVFRVAGRVPGLEATDFRRIAEEARSRSLRSTGGRDDVACSLESDLHVSQPT